jgi:hypothetical protein
MRSTHLTVLLALLTLGAPPARAWHHQTTHASINLKAVDAFQSLYGTTPKYERAALETTFECTGPAVTTPGKEWIYESDEALSIVAWISMGGYFADEPEWWASFRHFYDPIALDGQTYLTDDLPGLINPHVDARDLALKDQSDAWHDGSELAQYNWPAALAYYRAALENADGNERRNVAKAFRALGQVMHLVSDMTQPSHVRNDEHAYDDPVEDTIRIDQVAAWWNGPVDPNVVLDAPDVATLMDNLAIYANTNFYSADTIADDASGVWPANGKKAYASPQFKNLSYDAATHTYSGTFNGVKVPMVQERLTSYLVKKGMEWETVEGWTGWHLPPSFANGQAAVLIPIAVRACAQLLDRFLPTLDLQLTLTTQAEGVAYAQGALVHVKANDPAWSTTLSYNGPGVLYREGGQKLFDVEFVDGEMLPATFEAEPGDVFYLEIHAGGRVLLSPDTVFEKPEPGPECQILAACCPNLPTPAVIQQCEDIVATGSETNCSIGQASLLRLCRE